MAFPAEPRGPGSSLDGNGNGTARGTLDVGIARAIQIKHAGLAKLLRQTAGEVGGTDDEGSVSIVGAGKLGLEPEGLDLGGGNRLLSLKKESKARRPFSKRQVQLGVYAYFCRRIERRHGDRDGGSQLLLQARGAFLQQLILYDAGHVP